MRKAVGLIAVAAIILTAFCVVLVYHQEPKYSYTVLLNDRNDGWQSERSELPLPQLAKAAVNTAVDSLSLATKRYPPNSENRVHTSTAFLYRFVAFFSHSF